MLAMTVSGCTTMGDPPFVYSKQTSSDTKTAYDCIARTLAQDGSLTLDANRDAGFLKAQTQWRGGQFGVRDFVDQLTITVFTDDQNRTVIRAAVATSVDSKPDEPSQRGKAWGTAVVDACVR